MYKSPYSHKQACKVLRNSN